MKKIGKYEVCGLLGRGGMGKIYKVRIPVIGKTAALKLLDPYPALTGLVGEERLRRLFVSEASAMANLRHPNIVNVLDFGEDEGKMFYLMEYYCNNLGVMIGEIYWADDPSRILNLEKAIRYTHQTLEGLARLHFAGIVHRDIKPHNILVADHDVAKICDFGLSRLRGEKFGGPKNLKVGSPWYAAPEQEENPDNADFRADIYSVGVMLYRMLAGNIPQKDAPPVSKINPDLDDDWDRFIDRAIAPERDDRFATADEMLEKLRALETAWNNRKAKICAMPAVTKKEKTHGRVRLRNTGVKATKNKAGDIFKTDSLWRPSVHVSNEFTESTDETVFDKATGLLWQRSGTRYTVTWEKAVEYIEDLNRCFFAGRSDWRLPTVDELMSLLDPVPHNEDFCIPKIFDRKQKRLWSTDKCSHTAVWYVDVELGYVWKHDRSGYFHAKGVVSCQI